MTHDLLCSDLRIKSRKSVRKLRNNIAYKLISAFAISSGRVDCCTPLRIQDLDDVPAERRLFSFPTALPEASDSEIATELISRQRRNNVPDLAMRVTINASHDLLLLESNDCGQSPAGPKSLSGSFHHIKLHRLAQSEFPNT